MRPRFGKTRRHRVRRTARIHALSNFPADTPSRFSPRRSPPSVPPSTRPNTPVHNFDDLAHPMAMRINARLLYFCLCARQWTRDSKVSPRRSGEMKFVKTRLRFQTLLFSSYLSSEYSFFPFLSFSLSHLSSPSLAPYMLACARMHTGTVIQKRIITSTTSGRSVPLTTINNAS